jgi:hypothetical protein
MLSAAGVAIAQILLAKEKGEQIPEPVWTQLTALPEEEREEIQHLLRIKWRNGAAETEPTPAKLTELDRLLLADIRNIIGNEFVTTNELLEKLWALPQRPWKAFKPSGKRNKIRIISKRDIARVLNSINVYSKQRPKKEGEQQRLRGYRLPAEPAAAPKPKIARKMPPWQPPLWLESLKRPEGVTESELIVIAGWKNRNVLKTRISEIQKRMGIKFERLITRGQFVYRYQPAADNLTAADMTAADILRAATAAGVKFSIEGADIRANPEPTAELLAALRAHEADIRQLLLATLDETPGKLRKPVPQPNPPESKPALTPDVLNPLTQIEEKLSRIIMLLLRLEAVMIARCAECGRDVLATIAIQKADINGTLHFLHPHCVDPWEEWQTQPAERVFPQSHDRQKAVVPDPLKWR